MLRHYIPRRATHRLFLWQRFDFVVGVVAFSFILLQFVCMQSIVKKARLDEAMKRLGCSPTRRSFGRAEVVAQQIASHRKAAVHRALLGPTEYDNIQVYPINHHPAFNPMNKSYTPPSNWDVDIAIPDIAIVGLAKAGTTQLFRVLTSHPNATNFVKGRKEFCLNYDDLYELFEDDWNDDNDDTDFEAAAAAANVPSKRQLEAQKALFWHHKINFFVANKKPSQDKTNQLLTVNACYHIWDTEMTRHYLLPYAKKKKISDQKYIVLFRDPADLLWSAFNYWRIPGFDYGGEGMAVEGKNYRSPELFHELLLAGNRTKWFWEEVHNHHRRESVRTPRKLLGMFGPDSVLFLRNEDMLPSVVAKPGGVLDRVSTFTGLQRDLFPEDAYSNVANCNDKAMQNCGSNRSSTYRIAGNREMLPESRTLIYLNFLEECKIWKRDFGIKYPSCLNVLDTTLAKQELVDIL